MLIVSVGGYFSKALHEYLYLINNQIYFILIQRNKLTAKSKHI